DKGVEALNLNKATKDNTEINQEDHKERIINIEEIDKRGEKNCSNIEIILCLIELVKNKESYKFKHSEKSNHFWEEARKMCKVLGKLSSETLRKYWRLIAVNVEETVKMLQEIKNVR